MKTGKDIVALAQEIARRAEAKRDFVVATPAVKMVTFDTDSPKGPVGLEFGDEAVNVNKVAHGQLASMLGIPAKYYDRMLVEAPGLLTNNVNEWFAKYPVTKDGPAKKMIRTLDNTARAVMSDRYRPLENEELAEAVFPVLNDLGVEIMSSDITDTRFYIKAVDRRITKDIPVGKRLGDASHTFFDTLSPAITISNSEVGMGALNVKTSIFTKVCTNLATIEKAGSIRQYHIGGKHDIGEEVYALLSDQTRRLNDAALWAKVRDVVKIAFEQTRFESVVDEHILGMVEQKIAGDPVQAIDLTAKRFGFNDTERGSVLRHLIEGGDLSRYGLFNAVTRTAEDLDDYDRATDFERFGGDVINLPANDWKVIAEAA